MLFQAKLSTNHDPDPEGDDPDQDPNLEKLRSDPKFRICIRPNEFVPTFFISRHKTYEKVRFWMFGVKLYPDPSSDIEKKNLFSTRREERDWGHMLNVCSTRRFSYTC